MIRPKGLPAPVKDDGLVERTIEVECNGCGKKEQFTDLTTVSAMLQARKAGWGRGPRRGFEYCAECRLIAMMPRRVNAEFANA
jgi:hypothetical protein